MTTAVGGAPPIGGSRALQPLHIAAIAVATVLVSLLLFAVTPLQGRADFLVFTVALYAVAQSVASFTVEGRRRALDRLAGFGVRLAMIVALIPLVAILAYVTVKGAKKLSWSFLTSDMEGVPSLGPRAAGGGAYHAIIGTAEQVLIASLIAVPIGLLIAVYVVEYGKGAFATTIRYVMDVMTGVPSIVAGLFILAFWVLALKQGVSGFAAGLALAILEVPIVMRSAEVMLRLVPDDLREASYALGVPKWKTILRVVLPTASSGIITGVMLAIARVTGETAPVLLAAQLTSSTNTSPFSGAQAGIGPYVYDQAKSSLTVAHDRAWAAALTLIVIVLVFYLGARIFSRRNVLTN
jgi:phosphate transport system permease protein